MVSVQNSKIASYISNFILTLGALHYTILFLLNKHYSEL